MKHRVAKLTTLATLPWLGACSGPLSTLDPAGPHASEVASLWWGMLSVSLLVMLLVYVLWWLAMRRDGSKHTDEKAQHLQNRWVWWGGIGLPVAAITVLLGFGIPVGHRMLPVDEDALHIHVEARQWYWQVTYPDSGVTLIDELHIPVDQPVHIHVTSADVIHSFWVPRLGGKIDAIPGRTNVLRLVASESGEFDGQCAEYCGTAHAFMDFTVTAYEASEFEAWRSRVSEQTEEEGQ